MQKGNCFDKILSTNTLRKICKNGDHCHEEAISKLSKPLFQSEAKLEAIDMRTSFYSHANKSHFHKKSFPLSLSSFWK